MGLFGKKEICTICNVNESKKPFADGHICQTCIAKTHPFIGEFSWKKITRSDIDNAMQMVEINAERKKIFKPTKNVEKHISIDENNKMWQIESSSIIFTYDDIVSFELLEDGESITKGSVGGAVTGGLLFGGAGAIVGSTMGARTKKEVNELRIHIITRNKIRPEVYINFLPTGSVKAGSISYNIYKSEAQRVITELTLIMDMLSGEEKTKSSSSSADEILKFKALLDQGIISQEEFDAKKKQLLGL